MSVRRGGLKILSYYKDTKDVTGFAAVFLTNFAVTNPSSFPLTRDRGNRAVMVQILAKRKLDLRVNILEIRHRYCRR